MISPKSSSFRQQFWARPYNELNNSNCYFEVTIIPFNLINLINKMTISYFYLRLFQTSWHKMLVFQYHNQPRIVFRFSVHNKSLGFLFSLRQRFYDKCKLLHFVSWGQRQKPHKKSLASLIIKKNGGRKNSPCYPIQNTKHGIQTKNTLDYYNNSVASFDSIQSIARRSAT